MSVKASVRAAGAVKVIERSRAGEELVPVNSHPLLKRISRVSIWRWISSGRLCAISIGKETLTVDSLANEALLAGQGAPIKRGQHMTRNAEAMRRVKAVK